MYMVSKKMADFKKFKPYQLGTLYDSFKRTVKLYPNNFALRVPKKKDRKYYTDGFEITWKELNIEVDKLIKLYKQIIKILKKLKTFFS